MSLEKCRQCGTELYAKPNRVEDDDMWCSPECYHEWILKRYAWQAEMLEMAKRITEMWLSGLHQNGSIPLQWLSDLEKGPQ